MLEEEDSDNASFFAVSILTQPWEKVIDLITGKARNANVSKHTHEAKELKNSSPRPNMPSFAWNWSPDGCIEPEQITSGLD